MRSRRQVKIPSSFGRRREAVTESSDRMRMKIGDIDEIARCRQVYRRRFDDNSSPFIGGLPAPARLRILSALGRFARAAR